MPSSNKNVNIQFTDSALTFVKSRRLKNPLVLVNLGYRSGSEGSGGGCSGGGGGGGGCGGGGEAGSNVPYVNLVLADGENPGCGFVRVDTQAGVPVYMAKAVFDLAASSGNPLLMTVKGLVIKRLILEGLDVTALASRDPGKGSGSDH